MPRTRADDGRQLTPSVRRVNREDVCFMDHTFNNEVKQSKNQTSAVIMDEVVGAEMSRVLWCAR
jgi:hypothetical protein